MRAIEPQGIARRTEGARRQAPNTKLLDPATAAEAAIKLEAIGKPAADVLIAGTQSPDPARAMLRGRVLAYLGFREAAEPLGKAARNSARGQA